MTAHTPLTRQQRLAKQIETLSEYTGKRLTLNQWSGYGTPRRYQIAEHPYPDNPTAERDYSQSLTIGEMESAVSLAVKCAYDAMRSVKGDGWT